jgi:hypothetical protein
MRNNLFIAALAIGVSAMATNPVLSGFNHLLRPADARFLATGTTLIRSDLNSGSLFISPVQRFGAEQRVFGLNFIPTVVAGQSNSMMGTAYGASSAGNGVLSGGFRYYQAGSVVVRDNEGNELGTVTPYVVDMSVNYSMNLSERLTMGVGLRYLYSDLFQGQDNSAKLSTVNVDFAALYKLNEKSDLLVQLSELGPKMNTSNGAAGFAPTRFRIGYLSSFKLANKGFDWSIQLEKVLAPTAPILGSDGTVISGKPLPNGFLAPLVTSWNDAPGGFAEEVTEVRPSVGIAYKVSETLAVRSGYSYQSIQKGSLHYVGLGLSYSTTKVRFDAGYALGMAQLTNPMNNHIQVGLGYSL